MNNKKWSKGIPYKNLEENTNLKPHLYVLIVLSQDISLLNPPPHP